MFGYQKFEKKIQEKNKFKINTLFLYTSSNIFHLFFFII